MAYEIGSASNFEDLFTKIVNFLTTDTALVAANQEWDVLRLRRDNIANFTVTALTETTTTGYRKAIQCCRYDPRSLNTDPTSDHFGNFYSTSFTSGVSALTWQMRAAKEVKTVRLIGTRHTSHTNRNLKNFTLAYSDDGLAWTTALTVSTSYQLSLGETIDYEVPGTPGSHLYWKIGIVDTNSGASGAVAWNSLLLLEADETVANHFGSEIIFKARGNAGTDEIYTGIRSEYDLAAGWHILVVNGYTGFDPAEQSWFNQPGALPQLGTAARTPAIPCWDSTMPYWFVATGRSFRFVLKVSSSYEGGYLGFFLPYATPGQYPYPLAVGGSLTLRSDNRSAEWRYSYTNYHHSIYCMPGGDRSPDGLLTNTTLFIRSSDGSWLFVGNRPNAGSFTADGIQGANLGYSVPYTPSGAWRSVWPHCMNDQWAQGKKAYRECLGGGFILQPCVLLQRLPVPAVHGELEGTFAVSGYGNSTEDTTTYGGVDHVIFQNTYRSSVHEFWALSLNT